MLTLTMSHNSNTAPTPPPPLPLYSSDLVGAFILGYEPADLTVHPPQNCRGWVHFFRIGV